MLELRGVTYRYAGYARAVLHDVDLTLGDGEIVGLVGPNEAGKSTICLVASGLAPASIGGGLSGTLSIDGEPMAGRPIHELAQRVALGFQNAATQLSGVAGSVFEEVALGPMNLGLSVAETMERTHAALRTLLERHLVQQFKPQAVGQAHVGDDRIEAMFLELLAGLQQIADRFHPIPFPEQRQFVEGAQIRLVIDDENTGCLEGGRLQAHSLRQVWRRKKTDRCPETVMPI